MSADTTDVKLPESWLSRIGGGRDPSGWLSAFMRSPKQAVEDFLWDGFYFGPCNLTGREQLLTGWLDLLGNTERFAERLDEEFVQWINKHWGQFNYPDCARHWKDTNTPFEFLVSPWSCLCGVIEYSANLPEEAQLKRGAEALKERFADRERFLGSFSRAPAADPLGFYLAVVAQFQKDRSLADFWQRMCDLPNDVPFYRARYAMLGLRRLPAVDAQERGTLREEIVLGLLRLAQSFNRLFREGKLDYEIAKSFFCRVAAQTDAAYPNSLLWEKYGLAKTLALPKRPKKWVLEEVHPLAAAVRQRNREI